VAHMPAGGGQAWRWPHTDSTALLGNWVGEISALLAGCIPELEGGQPDAGTMDMVKTALEILVEAVSHIGQRSASTLVAALPTVWRLATALQGVYTVWLVAGADVDDEQAQRTQEAVCALMLFLSALAEGELQEILQADLRSVIALTIGCMQLSAEQVETWDADPNQFVVDDEDECQQSSVRHRCQGMLVSLCEGLGEPAVLAVLSCAAEGIQQAEQLQTAGQPHWWQLREACALTVGVVTAEAMDVESEAVAAQLNSFTANVVAKDATESCHVPYLKARALACTAALAHAFVPAAVTVLPAAIAALAPAHALPVRISACRAIAAIIATHDASSALLAVHTRDVLNALATLLGETNEDTVHLGLEALAMAIRVADAATCNEAVHSLVAQLLGVWQAHPADHLVAHDVIEAFEALGESSPSCAAVLHSTVLPCIDQLAQLGAVDAANISQVENGLEMLARIIKLKQYPLPPCNSPAHAVFRSLVTLLLTSDEDAALQGGADALTAYVTAPGAAETLLSWVDDDGQALFRIGSVVARLLGPSIEDRGAIYVGPLVTALVRTFPGQMAGGVLQNFLGAVVLRLCSASLKALVHSLLTVVAHLVMADPGGLIQFLATLPLGAQPGPALPVVMNVWLDNHPRFYRGLERKVSACALGTLLASMDPRLATVMIQQPLATAAAGKIVEMQAERCATPCQHQLFELVVEEAWQAGSRLTAESNAQAFTHDEDEGEDEDDDGVLLSDMCGLPSGHGFMASDEQNDNEDDPIHGIDLQVHLVQGLQEFAKADKAQFEHLFSTLSGEKQDYVKQKFAQ